MHQSSYHRIAGFRDMVSQRFTGGIKVLDIGSLGINGTYRDLFAAAGGRFEYTGLDIAAGPNVDLVAASIYSWPELKDGSFEIVISGQAFEHIEYPWLIMEEISRVLRPGGLACLVAPSRGPEHKYPLDCWRYYPDGFRALAKWAHLEVVEAGTLWAGSGFLDGSDQWGDTSCVLLKPASPATAVNTSSPLGDGKPGQYYGFNRRDVVDAIANRGLATGRVLDIGCARGAVGQALKARLAVQEYVGVELVPEAAEAAKKNIDRVILADVESVDLKDFGLRPQSFDMLLALDVLEHLYNPWDTLAALVKYIRPGGHAVVSLPNVQHVDVLLGLLNGSWQYQSAGILDATHMRFFTLESATQLVTGAGLEILDVEHVIEPAMSIAESRLKAAGLEVKNLRQLSTVQHIIVARRPAVPVDCVMLAFSADDEYKKMTQAAIDSLHASSTAYKFNVIVMETSNSPVAYAGAQVVQPGTAFNYNAYLNLGLARCTSDYVIMANNDLVFHPQWFEAIMAEAPDSASPWTDGYPLHNGRRDTVSEGLQVGLQVCGWCLVASRRVLDTIGKFDAQFDFWFQDNDYARQLHRYGFRHKLVGTSWVTHLHEKSHGLIRDPLELEARTRGAKAKFDAKYPR